MAFTYDITTDVGKVRFQIGDRVENTGVRPDGTNFSDEEIEMMLTELNDNILATSARLLSTLSAEWALLTDFAMGPRKESYSQVSKQYGVLASKLLEQMDTVTQTATMGFIRNDEYAYQEQYQELRSRTFITYHPPSLVEYHD
jgi:hypothetical protein